MKGTKKLGENEDWEACESTLQIGHLFGANGDQRVFLVRAPNWRSYDKQEKQGKKDYCEASDSVLEIDYFLGSNGVRREFHRKSSKMWLW